MNSAFCPTINAQNIFSQIQGQPHSQIKCSCCSLRENTREGERVYTTVAVYIYLLDLELANEMVLANKARIKSGLMKEPII